MILSPECRALSRTLQTEKLKTPLFPGPVGTVTTNDRCIMVNMVSEIYDQIDPKIRIKMSSKGVRLNPELPLDPPRHKIQWIIFTPTLNYKIKMISRYGPHQEKT